MRSAARPVALLSEDTKGTAIIRAPMKIQTRAQPSGRASAPANPRLQ